MEIPRWVPWAAIVISIVWLINDPAGMGQFFNTIGGNIETFFRNLG